jgi:F-type H+-transporting ATPase subunit a
MGVFWKATRRMSLRPNSWQCFGEIAYEALRGLTIGVIGPSGQKYVPLIGSLFLYIFTMNMIGIIPGFTSPTSSLGTTFPMAVFVILFVQVEAIRAHGFVGYLKHFTGGAPFPISVILFIAELVGEFVAKPISLSMRLFGNIFGEDMVLVVLAGLLPLGLEIGGVQWRFFPLQFPVLLLAMFTSFVQALIFSMLTAVYLSVLATPHDDHGHAEGAHAH